MGSFRHHGCEAFVRTEQRGWDLLDFMDVMTLYTLGGDLLGFEVVRLFYALTRGGGDLSDIMDVLTLYALTKGGGFFE